MMTGGTMGTRLGTIQRSIALAIGVALLSLGAASFATAQDYPKRRPIRVIVAQGAGSATDIMARLLATKMSESFGQQFYVENKPGAGGSIGAEQAAKSAPDGYTLFLASISTHGVNPGLYKKLPYDPIKDFAPISLTATTGNMVVVNAKLPITSIAELVAYAKENPGKLTYASAGQGSSQQLATELFAVMAGRLKMLHVPYRGTSPGLVGVMAGEVDWMMPAIPSGLSAINSGLARAIAVTTRQRSPDFPDVPAVAETFPGYDVTTWYGLVAPAGTPEPIILALNAGVRTALSAPDARTSLSKAGLDLTLSSPVEFGAFMKTEIDRWAAIAKNAGIALE